MLEKAENPNAEQGSGGRLSFDAIRQSLRQLRPSGNAQQNERSRSMDPMSLSAFKNSLRLRPSDSGPQRTVVIGGTEPLPASVFAKEMREKRDGESSNAMKTEFVKMYSYGELGEKLRNLRPEGQGEGWFSMKELNERLMKLREFEEKETESRVAGLPFRDLRESLVKLKLSEDEKSKQNSSKLFEGDSIVYI